MTAAPAILLLLAALSATPAVPLRVEPREDLLRTVRGFYAWVLVHHKEVAALEPKVVDVKGSTKFYLDTKTLHAFADRFLASGYFTRDFPSAVERYYKKYQDQFAAMPQRELDQMAKDGRGPLLETEDMDLFFCAQEYEYKKDFVDHLKLTSVSVQGDTATAEWSRPTSGRPRSSSKRRGDGGGSRGTAGMSERPLPYFRRFTNSHPNRPLMQR